MLKIVFKNNIYFKNILKNNQFLIEFNIKIIMQIPCINMKIFKNFKLEFVDIQQMNGTKLHTHKSNSSNLTLLKNLKHSNKR